MADQRRSAILRQYKETDTQFAKREFNYCMYHLGRCHELQAERVRMGWSNSAIFYQQQSVEWYERAVECRARHDQALAELIPGTSVRWDEIFTQCKRGPRQTVYFGRIMHGPHQTTYFIDKAGPDAVLPKWKTTSNSRPRPAHYTSPKDRYDNPRDVPLTLAEISAQLKRWLS